MSIRLIPLLLMTLLAGLSANADEIERQSGFVDVPGGPVWYEIMGGGDGIPLLTLHGGPGGTSCGLQVLAPLGDERPVIRYDQLGTGRSGRPTDLTLWNRDRFVEELDTLRRELGLTEMHLLGHSWGGALAAYYVLEKGDDGIKSLILSSPLISTSTWIADANLLRHQLPEDVQAVLDEHERLGTTDSEAYRKATAEFYAKHVTRGDAVEAFTCPDAPWNPQIYNQMWGPTEFYANGSLGDFDLAARLSQIHVPTLFIAGEFDDARPETIAKYANAVPGAKFVEIAGVGHASSSRRPKLYRRIIEEFIDQVEHHAVNGTAKNDEKNPEKIQ